MINIFIILEHLPFVFIQNIVVFIITSEKMWFSSLCNNLTCTKCANVKKIPAQWHHSYPLQNHVYDVTAGFAQCYGFQYYATVSGKSRPMNMYFPFNRVIMCNGIIINYINKYVQLKLVHQDPLNPISHCVFVCHFLLRGKKRRNERIKIIIILSQFLTQTPAL